MSSQQLPPVQEAEITLQAATSQYDETRQAVPSSDAVLPSSPSPERDRDHDDLKAATLSTSQPSQPTTDTATQPPNPAVSALQLKLDNLQCHLMSLQQLHATHLQTHNSTLPSGLPIPSHWTPAKVQTHALETANDVIKEHIALLHGYNEIKDVGMGLLGLVAEKRGLRVKEVMEEFGVGEKD